MKFGRTFYISVELNEDGSLNDATPLFENLKDARLSLRDFMNVAPRAHLCEVTLDVIEIHTFNVEILKGKKGE